MIEYRVIGSSVNLTSGNLKLSDDQYRRREHVLEPMGDGVYKIVLTPNHKKVQFKRGEIIWYDGTVNKGLLKSLCPEEDEEEKKDDPVDDTEDENIIEAMEVCVEKGHVTKTGMPELPMLNEMLGFNVSAKDRDRLFAKHFKSDD